MQKTLLLACIVAAVLPFAAAKPPVAPAYTYAVSIDPAAVYDGDTVTEADIDVGFRIRTTQRLRLLGVDCPEIRPRNADGKRTAADLEAERKAAIAARDFVRAWIRDHTELVVETRRDKIATDSFDRWLARIHGTKNGQQTCLNDELLEQRHARKFRED